MNNRILSNGERKVRINEVAELLIEGKSTASVRKHCSDKWDLKRDAISKYITAADKLIGEAMKGKKVAKIARAVAQRENLIEKLIDTKNYGAAIQGLADKDKLQGLYEQDAQEVNVSIEVVQR